MNEVAKWLWYTDIINSVTCLLGALLALSIISIIIGLGCDNQHTRQCKGRMIAGISFFISIIIISILILLPSNRTMLFITASNATTQVMQTQDGQKAITVLDKKLDEYLKGN